MWGQRHHQQRRRQRRRPCWMALYYWVAAVGLMISPEQVQSNVAYPGIWTGRQPNGLTTGTEQVLIGNPEYHFSVVETDDSFYPTIRGYDGTIFFAARGKDGRLTPTNVKVGSVHPDEEPTLHGAIHETRHSMHAECIETAYCRWKKTQRQTNLSEYYINPPNIIKEGSIANLVIPFEFLNHKGSRTPIPTEDLDRLLFNGDFLSVKDYFLKQSYGKLEIVSEILSRVQIPYTEQQCADRKSGLTQTMHVCLEAALEEAAKVLGADWTTIIESAATVTFVHSGYAAEYGGNDIDGAWYEDRIWSHSWELTTNDLYQGRYALISDKYDRKNDHVNRVGVAVHELAQALGAPTMYGDYPGYGLGYYDMMANPWGFDGTLTHCGSMSPYIKNLFGWIHMEEITTNGLYQLEQSTDSNKVYVIRQGFPEGEYLIIENRQEEGYDKGINQPGLAIWHIDEKATNVNAHPKKGNYPQDHYIVALMQADGRFDLERMEDEGDSGDLFHAGRFSGIGPNGVFLPNGNLQLGGSPNTNSYQGGQVTPTGITITNISASSSVMTFEIHFAQ